MLQSTITREGGDVSVTQRFPEHPMVTLPQGISLRAGSINTMPDSMYGIAHQEGAGTNETVRGIFERARFIREKYGQVSTFAGVGNPIKVLAQAALLEPTDYLGFVDISGQNTFDTVLLLSTLRNGFTSVRDFVTTTEGKQLFNALCSVIPDEIAYKVEFSNGNIASIVDHTEYVNKYDWHIRDIDTIFHWFLDKMNIDIESVRQVVQVVKSIGIQFDDIRSEEVFTNILQDRVPNNTGTIVIDTSNIPFSNPILDNSPFNPLIFFSYFGRENARRADNIPNHGHDTTKNGSIHFWNYPEDQGIHIVGLADYSSYHDIRANVDEWVRQW